MCCTSGSPSLYDSLVVSHFLNDSKTKNKKTANEGNAKDYCTIITRKSQNKSATCVILKTILEKKCAHLMSLAF